MCVVCNKNPFNHFKLLKWHSLCVILFSSSPLINLKPFYIKYFIFINGHSCARTHEGSSDQTNLTVICFGSKTVNYVFFSLFLCVEMYRLHSIHFFLQWNTVHIQRTLEMSEKNRRAHQSYSESLGKIQFNSTKNRCYFCTWFSHCVRWFYFGCEKATDQKAINCICCFVFGAVDAAATVVTSIMSAVRMCVSVTIFCRTQIVFYYRYMPIVTILCAMAQLITAWNHRATRSKSFYFSFCLFLFLSNLTFCQFYELVGIALVCDAYTHTHTLYRISDTCSPLMFSILHSFTQSFVRCTNR